MKTECCGTCHYWRLPITGDGRQNEVTEETRFADCRRRAPSPGSGQASTVREYWCGEWQPNAGLQKVARPYADLAVKAYDGGATWYDCHDRPPGFITDADGQPCEFIRDGNPNVVYKGTVWVTENGFTVFRAGDDWCTDVSRWKLQATN